MTRIKALVLFLRVSLAVPVFLFGEAAVAMEFGHYLPGGTSLRDFIMPLPGIYFEQFNMFYTSGSFMGQNGKKIKELGSDAVFNYLGYAVAGGGDFEMRGVQYSTSPTFAMVSGIGPTGLKYGLAVAPAFGYVKGKLKIGETEVEQSDAGLGDLYVQPAWLGWGSDHSDIMLGYGFFAPTGRYDDDRLANMGMGFWSHEIILTVAGYADKGQDTAVVINATYEFNSEKGETNVRPGDALSLEYGVSHMFTKAFGVDLAGYSLWQVTADKGAGVDYDDVRDFTNAAGCEINYSMFNGKLTLSFRYMYEYAVRERMRGQMFVFNAGYSF
ncbi:MAG: transporter [Candidatus Omnitrophota bacterium]